jgi:hypothetical protein
VGGRPPAECRARASFGLGGIEVFFANEALGFHLYMEADLLVGARLGGARRQD